MKALVRSLLVLCLLLAAVPAAAGTPSAADRADMRRIEAYLNAIRTAQARFVQMTSQGGLAKGTFYLSRPGKLRFQYDPPAPFLVVADGTFLIYHDTELGQVSYIPLGATPAGILVRENVAFEGGDLVLQGFERGPGVMALTLVQKNEPESGKLTLVFTDKPLQLRQWQVTDAQGVQTVLTLDELRTGMTFEDKLFEFVDPSQKFKFAD